MRQATQRDLTLYRLARQDHDVVAGNVYFYFWLEGPGGAGFCLFREAHHTDADIERAKHSIMGSRDVVGPIEVCDIAGMLTASCSEG